MGGRRAQFGVWETAANLWEQTALTICLKWWEGGANGDADHMMHVKRVWQTAWLMNSRPSQTDVDV